MTPRLILALLALLAGIAAQLSPAQARIREGASEVGVIALSQEQRIAAAPSMVLARPAIEVRLQRHCAAVPPSVGTECAPTVLIGIDRARK